MLRYIVAGLLCGGFLYGYALADNFPEASQALLDQAKTSKRYADAKKLDPDVVATSDGKSFALVWEAPSVKGKPHKWIVSLHGSNGYASEDLAIWAPHLRNREIGIICLQWWFGKGGKTEDYYTPRDIYRELDILLRRMNVKPGEVMLEGFSRASANIYAVAAIDRNKGRKYFNLFVANSGGATLSYPPTGEIEKGSFGSTPFEGSNWATVCGESDPNPERDGCSAMQRTSKWLEKLGAKVVISIEDKKEGHGAFHRNPANVAKVLDWYL